MIFVHIRIICYIEWKLVFNQMITSIDQEGLSVFLQKLKEQLSILFYVLVSLYKRMREQFFCCPSLLRISYNAAMKYEIVKLLRYVFWIIWILSWVFDQVYNFIPIHCNISPKEVTRSASQVHNIQYSIYLLDKN